MKYLFTFIAIIFATTATAQTTTFEASLESYSTAYTVSPDNIMFASLSVGHRKNLYTSASVSIRPLTIGNKFTDKIQIEPLAFFEYGYDGSTFTNYGVGVYHQINEQLSASVKYSKWGGMISITFH